MKLTAKNVTDVTMDCLFKEGENVIKPIIVHGIRMNVGFNPDRIANNCANIGLMLMQLPTEFRKNGGGGWSFLNMCNDIDGNQWSDLHSTMENLMLLGLACGYISPILNRNMWHMLPDGMPYVFVLDDVINAPIP